MKKSQVQFKTSALEKVIFENLVKEQSRRLVAYAQATIQQIGDAIRSYHSRNHMDRTGNLLDSLCWGVSYRGQLVGSGFYREQRATKLSYLHEWFHFESQPVGGHLLAQNFIKQMGNLNYGGWRVFFAILAPYWGYWEEGFTFKGKHRQTFLRFAIMTQFYDTVAKELSPAKVSFKTKAPTYTYDSLSKQWSKRDKRAGKGRKGFSVYNKYKGNYKF